MSAIKQDVEVKIYPYKPIVPIKIVEKENNTLYILCEFKLPLIHELDNNESIVLLKWINKHQPLTQYSVHNLMNDNNLCFGHYSFNFNEAMETYLQHVIEYTQTQQDRIKLIMARNKQ